MEEELRQLLLSTYPEDPAEARTPMGGAQLERLKRGELPRTEISSVAQNRDMRRARTRHLECVSKASHARRR